MNEQELLKRITVNPKIFGGKPIVRGRRLAVEHILGRRYHYCGWSTAAHPPAGLTVETLRYSPELYFPYAPTYCSRKLLFSTLPYTE